MTLIWVGAYTILQIVELIAFDARSPWFFFFNRHLHVTGLSLLVLNSTVFAGFGLLQIDKIGIWGQAGAAYVLSGAILNTAVTTIGCRSAFYASVLPFAVYLGIFPVSALEDSNQPSSLVLTGITLSGTLMLLCAIRLWSKCTNARAAELAAIARDIAERQANERRLFRLAHFDTLTGLGNRNTLQERLADYVASNTAASLLMVDLDGFKYVNDTLGHSAGDEVLRVAGARIMDSARIDDLVVRLGGDEFAVLLTNAEDPAVATMIATRVIAALSQPVCVDSRSVNIGASVGVSMFPQHGGDVETLVSSADLALHRAKSEGRHCSRFFDPQMRVEAQSKLSRDNELLLAIERGEFELFYQPQIRLADKAVIGAEALLRWRHPVHGLLTPDSFLAALDNGRLAAQVGDWTIQTACTQAAVWIGQGLLGFRVAVNLFGAQFRTGNLVATVNEALMRARLAPESLELEITENIILSHEDRIVEPLRELRAQGVEVAFDDYGTGYASLSLLKRYPLSRLKIDQSFVRTVCENPSDAAIVSAIVSMARACELKVIAEGVETQDQADRIARFGCDEVQGYLFGKPLCVADFSALVKRQIALSPALLA